MNGKLRVCRKCLPGQKNEEAFYEDLSRYIQRMDEELKVDQQTNSVPRSQSGVLSRNNTNSLKKRVDPQTVLQRNPHGSHITDSKAERDMQGAG